MSAPLNNRGFCRMRLTWELFALVSLRLTVLFSPFFCKKIEFSLKIAAKLQKFIDICNTHLTFFTKK